MEKEITAMYVEENADLERAKKISEKFNIKIITDNKETSGLTLYLSKSGLSLVYENMKLSGDFSKMIKRIKQNNLQNEILIHAAKIKEKTRDLMAIDATAGMGEDSMLLAAYGYNISLYENNPIIAELLKDSLERAKQFPELKEIVSRMKVYEEDSIIAMQKLEESPDIILLDPMFPERTKSSLIKKKFQVLHKIENPCLNESELLNSAIKANPKKIIIKRPLKGDYLAGIKPDYSLKGNSIRYDCIINISRFNKRIIGGNKNDRD